MIADPHECDLIDFEALRLYEDRLYTAEKYEQLRFSSVCERRCAVAPVSRRDWRWKPTRDVGL